jgi:competence protein ComEC
VVDPRPVLLAVMAWAGCWVATRADPTWVFICSAVGALIALLSWGRRSWLGVAAGLMLLVSVGCSGLRVLTPTPLHAWAAEQAVVTVEGVCGPGRSGKSFAGAWWQATMTVESVTGRGETWQTNTSVRVVASGALAASWSELAPGARIRAAVRLGETTEPEANAAVARAREPPQVLAGPELPDAVVEYLHQGLREAVSGLAKRPRALVPALVVGDISAMDDDLRDEFKATGLTHLTAVSGANLTILLGCAALLAGRFLRGWKLRVLLTGVVAFFVLLCRSEPSVLRAAVMGVIGLSALGWGRTSAAMRFLCWAVIVLLLIDPWMAVSTAFCLSVAATAGIVCWAQPWALALGRRIPLWLAEAICVPLAAQLATQPIIVAISGQLSLVGVVANMIAAPLVAPATVLGFAALALAVVSPWLAAIPGTMAGWFAQGLCWVSEFCAGFPGAVVELDSSPQVVALVVVGGLGVVLVLPRVWSSGVISLGLAVALVAAILQPVPHLGWPPDGWAMVSCDVGQGDATVFNAGGSAALLVDTGPEPAAVDACLRELRISDVTVLLSHLHADHVGGLSAVGQGRKLQAVILSEVHSPQSAWRDVNALAAGAQLITATPGMVFQVGSLSIEVLATKPFAAAGPASEGESSAENDSSLVIRVETGEFSAVVAGDVEESGQRNALQSDRLSADVLVVPHHGSAHQLPEFLQAVSPSLALISVGRDNGYGHPAPSLLSMLAGTPVYRTDLNGSVAVAVVADGSGLEVKSVK